MSDLIIEYKNTDSLIPYVNNSRTHSDEQVTQVASSIKEFGFTNPILIDEQGGIIAGHGRLMAANKLGLEQVPTITLVGLSEAQRKAYVIADNKLALNSGWDNELLSLEIAQLGDMGFDIDLLGFDADELAELQLDVEVLPDGDEDAVPELQDDPISKLGDIWQLGNHRLMCGDSTSIDAVEKLLDGVKIDLVHTDPPYGIGEKGDRSGRGGLAQGSNLPDFDDSSTDAAKDAYNLCEGLGIPRQVWWGANYYAHAVPETANWFVWDKRVEDKQKDTQSDCELAWVKSKWASVRIFRHVWKGMIKDSEHGQKRVHPTQKPVALIEWVIDYYRDVKTVLDLFGGSGSTLIACERKACSSYLMELEPYYTDVIIKRWQDYTGKQAIHIDSGKTYDELAGDSDAAITD
ncbi:DNA methylase [Psychrobacter phage pOW20-A]|uniref:DNA methyltransferase n=1 Tax=Psychrobacter phage pOW20-A TaxID=754048 RepID=UPI0002C18ACF|nr:DNA methyltransferase [Psychrobacter phage pOW20-A]AGH57500.1 DNA methylase [Psychrobacter phage pOW20-A]